MGEDAPEENGHSPQTCTVVPRHSFTEGTSRAMPPPRPGQPRAPGPASRACLGAMVSDVVAGFTVFDVFAVKSLMRAIRGRP
ncbi:hypothetical protein Pure05_34180 [Paenarthrobacter ureafaciens]|nr:hypothetical protein Pure01_34200 [Paenarthrobacter ureafaciens]GLU65177.1 hypothetical protein Pure02_34270 [Paenarthrobacter ureafaciens]GLU69390.1 hypothetical protein Pure03_33660 [Paenarthrobacter ureafaciens]GLU73607.1 hypothetical protein Pure04_33220 [Paenarthrobacter ureafaciens]GLU77978.1 hypothetical protein Pure05_34180 [Paenarthrobacter ureafaciens]